MGAESTLHELARLTDLWLDLYEDNWLTTSSDAWQKLIQSPDEADQDRVRKRLKHLERHVTKLIKSCHKVKAPLSKMIARIRRCRSEKKHA